MSRSYLIIGSSKSSRLEYIRREYLKIRNTENFTKDPDTQILDDPISVKIQAVRELEKTLSLKPFLALPKIVIIPQAETLTFEAQSAMLKILEEPPSETIFFLSAPDEEGLLPTVVSRCYVNYLSQPDDLALNKDELKAEKKTYQVIIKSKMGQRIKFTENLASRDTALTFCQKQLFVVRTMMLEKPDQKYVMILKEIQKTIRLIKGNVNARLAVENLLLNYPEK